MQAGIAALALGLLLRHVPSDAHPAVWPYAVGAYGLVAAFLPWVVSVAGRLVQPDDLTLRVSVLFGIFVAAPAFLVFRWLAATPYRVIGFGCWLLIAGWAAHLVATIVYKVRRPV